MSSNKYKKEKFSAFLESGFPVNAAIDYARETWGDKPYGIVRLRYSDVVAAGFRATFIEEDGNKYHVDLVPDPNSKLGKKARARAMVDCTKVVVPWGGR